MNNITKLLCSVACLAATSVSAKDLEVTHWWTSGGEAAAVSTLAKAFNAKTEHNWVDGAIAGGGGTSIPAIISRIIGGEPMGATQLNHGRQAQELIEAGLMTDLTDIAEAQGWRDIVNPVSLLDSCTVDGRVYCVPVNIHSAQWLWVSHGAFEKAGLAIPTNWDEFVAGSAELEKNGIVPLAMGQQGWQQSIAFGALVLGVVGVDKFLEVTGNKNADVAAGPEWTRAHTGMCVIDVANSYESIRYFQQIIFGQDKSILENQFPKRLPLDSRAETPIRADKSAIAYRRWLAKKGLTYGVIPSI